MLVAERGLFVTPFEEREEIPDLLTSSKLMLSLICVWLILSKAAIFYSTYWKDIYLVQSNTYYLFWSLLMTSTIQLR